MVFGLNFYLSLLYSYFVSYYCRTRHYNMRMALALLAPLFAIWWVLCGGQYDVGTDYFSYMRLFAGNDLDLYIAKGEVLFVAVVRLCRRIGLEGQALFYVFYAINFTFLALVMKRLKTGQLFLFVLLYIVVTSLFNNQLNGLRQATATYIGTYAVLLWLERRRWAAVFFTAVAFMFHNVACVFLLVFLCNGLVRRLSPKYLLVILIAFSAGTVAMNVSFFEIFIEYLPANYAAYISSNVIEERHGLVILMKYIYFPLYLLSLFYFNRRKELSQQPAKAIYNWGVIAYALRLLVANVTIISRVFDIFLIFSIFPLLYFLYAIAAKHRTLYCLIVAFLIAVYSAKVLLFPTREYAYQSIYFL